MNMSRLPQTLLGTGSAALRSMATSLAVACGLGGVIVPTVWYFADRAHPGAGLPAGVFAAVECAVVGMLIAVHRGIMAALVHMILTAQLGRKTVAIIFDNLMNALGPRLQAWRSGEPERARDLCPLAQAEAGVSLAAASMAREPESGGGPQGWLRRRIRRRLVAAVKRFMLSRFRDESTGRPGLDLDRLRIVLEDSVDHAIVSQLRTNTDWLTIGVLWLTPVQIFCVVFLVIGLAG